MVIKIPIIKRPWVLAWETIIMCTCRSSYTHVHIVECVFVHAVITVCHLWFQGSGLGTHIITSRTDQYTPLLKISTKQWVLMTRLCVCFCVHTTTLEYVSDPWHCLLCLSQIQHDPSPYRVHIHTCTIVILSNKFWWFSNTPFSFPGNGHYRFTRSEGLCLLPLRHSQHHMWQTPHSCPLECKI